MINKLKEGYKELFNEFKFTHAVTLAYNPAHGMTVSRKAIDTDLRRFYVYTESKLINKNFRLVDKCRRSQFIGMIENAHRNAHIHLLWNIPRKRDFNFIESCIKRYWMYMAERGTVDVQVIYDGRGWAAYTTKDLRSIYDIDNFVEGGRTL